MNRRSRLCRVAALAAYAALLTLLLNWYTWLAPPAHVPISVALAVTAIPLLFPLRGLLHGRPYTHAWTSFLALPYFALGIDAIAGGIGPTWLGAGVTAASAVLFAASVGYARARGRELRTAAGLDE